ncbi:unnamed protein product [Lepeophtheirus salmonis]|uniref:(salmon louse) hypothetical protein n=1 Tax=Lepeophtheirus salmonis TaxID=72036 RepID=A0A7R8CSB1_LEPSM|nr:unnamed protein product [Lepeophtheirus salmonis]CAF2875718.1 unnamed protein product [Lepeophtheirus salmonis]
MWKLECPAWGKNCNKCKRLNHFEPKCPKSNAIPSVDALANRVTRTIIRKPKNRKPYSVEFIAVKKDLTPLLGLKAAKDEFSNVFESLGTLQGQVSLNLDESVQPVISPSRGIPVALQLQVLDHIANASRALSDAESRWAQIEKEMFAVVFGLESSTTILMVLTLYYKPGTQIPIADALSRDPLPEGSHDDIATVNLINSSPIKADCRKQIENATTVDTSMA